MLGPILMTLHNLHYYQEIMSGLREAIAAGRLSDFAEDFHSNEAKGDLEAL